MRLLISETPGMASKAKVFVGGVDVSSRCYGADEELGEAYCYVMADKGMVDTFHTPDCVGTNCTMDTPDGCRMVREVLRGEVRIEINGR